MRDRHEGSTRDVVVGQETVALAGWRRERRAKVDASGVVRLQRCYVSHYSTSEARYREVLTT